MDPSGAFLDHLTPEAGHIMVLQAHLNLLRIGASDKDSGHVKQWSMNRADSVRKVTTESVKVHPLFQSGTRGGPLRPRNAIIHNEKHCPAQTHYAHQIQNYKMLLLPQNYHFLHIHKDYFQTSFLHFLNNSLVMMLQLLDKPMKKCKQTVVDIKYYLT